MRSQFDYDYFVGVGIAGGSSDSRNNLFSHIVKEQKPTGSYLEFVGKDFEVKKFSVPLKDGEAKEYIISGQFWLMPIEDRFSSISCDYTTMLANKRAIFFVANGDEEELKQLQPVLDRIKDKESGDRRLAKFLIMNKDDIESKPTALKEQFQRLADEHHMNYSEYSFETGEGVEELLKACAKTCLSHQVVAEVKKEKEVKKMEKGIFERFSEGFSSLFSGARAENKAKPTADTASPDQKSEASDQKPVEKKREASEFSIKLNAINDVVNLEEKNNPQKFIADVKKAQMELKALEEDVPTDFYRTKYNRLSDKIECLIEMHEIDCLLKEIEKDGSVDLTNIKNKLIALNALFERAAGDFVTRHQNKLEVLQARFKEQEKSIQNVPGGPSFR
jgi:hypothetical protein